MKSLLLITFFVLTANSAFAQTSGEEESQLRQAIQGLVEKFHTVGIGSLVDQMEMDGVTQRNYSLTFAAEGAWESMGGGVCAWPYQKTIRIFDPSSNGATSNFLPFSISLTSENQVQVELAWREGLATGQEFRPTPKETFSERINSKRLTLFLAKEREDWKLV